jgi:hypothetical protein
MEQRYDHRSSITDTDVTRHETGAKEAMKALSMAKADGVVL